ncbi:MAG: hypothetical protein GEV03_04210 [Streptosporangiales bacterium]|nr:hypothetical protein [Streptosporangiales bacterium]
MTDVPGFQVDGELAVVEEPDAYVVVLADDHADWLARFEKTASFPAREWAENMVRIYNRRRSRRPPPGEAERSAPLVPPGSTPASYHPEGMSR